MTQLREPVTVITPIGNLTGELFVGMDGLPELLIPPNNEHLWLVGHFRPATLPHEWIVTSDQDGVLYRAWDLIWNLIEELAIAQREAETEDRDRAQQRENLEIDEEERERVRNQSIDNQIALEVDNDQAD